MTLIFKAITIMDTEEQEPWGNGGTDPCLLAGGLAPAVIVLYDVDC